MKDKEGRSKPNDNTQVAVDDTCGAIVAADVNDETHDRGQRTPMVEQVVENFVDKPASISADRRYNTGPDLAAMEEPPMDCSLPDAGPNSEAAPSSGVRRFLRRGLEKVKTEWIMVCTAVNLGIMLRPIGRES